MCTICKQSREYACVCVCCGAVPRTCLDFELLVPVRLPQSEQVLEERIQVECRDIALALQVHDGQEEPQARLCVAYVPRQAELEEHVEVHHGLGGGGGGLGPAEGCGGEA